MVSANSLYGKWIFGQLGNFINEISFIIKAVKKGFFAQIGCDLYGIFGGLFGFISITTMAFMSIERFLIVKNPLFALKITRPFILSNLFS